MVVVSVRQERGAEQQLGLRQRGRRRDDLLRLGDGQRVLLLGHRDSRGEQVDQRCVGCALGQIVQRAACIVEVAGSELRFDECRQERVVLEVGQVARRILPRSFEGLAGGELRPVHTRYEMVKGE